MKVQRTIFILIPLLILGLVVYFFTDIVAYLLISWVLSLIAQPIMSFFQRIHIGKAKLGSGISAVLTIIVLIFFIGITIGLFAPLVIELATNLSQVSYESLFLTIQEPLQKVGEQLEKWGLVSSSEISFEEFTKVLGEYFKPSALGNFASSLVGAASSLLIGIFSVLFITFFFLKESSLFTSIVLAMVPNEYESATLEVIDDIRDLLRNYFGGIVLQVFIITLFVSIGLSLFGIKNALLIGFFAALINLIPYIGPMIGGIFGIFITISSNLDADFNEVLLPKIIIVISVFALMQMLDNFVLQPFIYSKSVKAHPLEIFVLILVAAKVGGITGMILAIPTYTILRVIASVFLNQFKLVQKITSRLTENDSG